MTNIKKHSRCEIQLVGGVLWLAVCAAFAALNLQAAETMPPPSKEGVTCADGIRIEKLAPDILRVRESRDGKWPSSMLNRYGILENLSPETVAAAPDGFAMPKIEQTKKGFRLEFPLAKDERVYGLGDSSRASLNRRGMSYDIWVENVTSYIPIPMVITSKGRGIVMNATRRHMWDVGKTNPDALVISSDEGEVDFYLLAGGDYRALLEAYTRLAGRPQLLPAFAYGFAYVANQWLDQYEVVAEASKFRELDFPCDVFGLEPGWMEGFYDSTTKKQWNKRFEVPFYAHKNPAGGDFTWMSALRRMGFKLSLWLCTRYDHFIYEEALADGRAKPISKRSQRQEDEGDGTFVDEHIDAAFIGVEKPKPVDIQKLAAEVKHTRRQMSGRVDGLTGDKQSGEEPWFEHLKGFVDDGARCFKLDGAWQVVDFPGRVWAGKYSNEEAHNAYPLVYDKQMATGYEGYTGKRAMVYSAGGYLGLQRFVATWAGDTGGGVKTLVSTLNLGVSGHPNQSCDMDVADLPSLHYGVFAPWSQQNNWDFFAQPWHRERKDFESIRNYVRLRYRLFPYIYTAAAEAAKTGWPIVRPLAFVYPDRAEYADECGTYLFGDDLLVSAFASETIIPPGTWYEWRTGEKVVGPCKRPVNVGDGWGGGLYVRAGAIVPMRPDGVLHIDKGWNETVEFHVWPGDSGKATLYEDDGDSLAYRNGVGGVTEVELGMDRGWFWSTRKLSVLPRNGTFDGANSKRNVRVVWHEEGGTTTMQERPDVAVGDKVVFEFGW